MTSISIVTPSLNQGAFLAEALNSVRLQRYAKIEHLVIDGGSTDSTLALLRARTGPEWAHLKWSSAQDGGQSQAINKGLRLASGQIVGWLNSDDRYRSECFERVVEAFDRHPEVDIFYGDYTFIDGKGNLTCIRREIAFNYFVLLYHSSFIHSTSAFFRRRIFDEGNWLDERMHYAMDYEFFLRLADKGYRIRHLPAVLADFRQHPASKTFAFARRQRAEMRRATETFSCLVRSRRHSFAGRVCFRFLQCAAGAMRYSEKFLRGYYWNQRRPSTLTTTPQWPVA
jgi:glycosyltransferase involved in cell wall biosynthesis